MELTQIKHVIEAALLAAGRPLPLDKLASIFAARAPELDKDTLRSALEALAGDYQDRGLELKEVASGYRIQIKSSMTDWLTPLWEERAPRYTRALLETLALIAYRQPITRAEIEEVRGVVVSTNIVRTLLERNWVRVVGHRDVPGKPAMFGTTRDFLDYFGLRKLEDLPALADIKDGMPEESPQADLIEALSLIEGDIEGDATEAAGDDEPELDGAEVSAVIAQAAGGEEEDEGLLAAEAEAEAEAEELSAEGVDEDLVDEAADKHREEPEDLAGDIDGDLEAEVVEELAGEADEDLAGDVEVDFAEEVVGELADEAHEDAPGEAGDEFVDEALEAPANEAAENPADAAADDLVDRTDAGSTGQAEDELEDETGEDVALRRF